MPRVARLKVEEGAAWYHVCARVAGHKGEYPLGKGGCSRRLVDLLRHFCKAYFCQVAGFCVMGNHYHLLLRFDEARPLERGELERRARVLYPRSRKVLEGWSDEQWARLECRLFDLSELMRNLQAAFARWYNRAHTRRGRFWAERFKSTLLEDGQAVVDCLLYVELNPVRAGLVVRPEDYEGSSCFLRHAKADRWLMGIAGLVGARRRREAMGDYRCLLYHRGSVPSKEGQAAIPDSVVEAEAARGYAASGAFSKRLRYFVDGVAVGSEGFVLEVLSRLREAGVYRRRVHPIRLAVGEVAALREQRSHAVGF
jgi:REP element-mobilizing transposase RayT